MTNERKTVKQLREERGWKQIDLAYHAGTSLSTISNIEARKQEPRIALAQRIADALGVSLDAVDWTATGVDRTHRGKGSRAAA